jgi:hypothetical protein
MRCASFKVGTTTPKEIVEIMRVIKKAFSIKPAITNKKDKPSEKINIPAKIIPETMKVFGSFLPLGSVGGFLRPVKTVKSISNPLRNIKNINPNVERVDSHISS